MSFSSDIKKELARTEPEKTCCQLAELAGFLRVASSVNIAGGGKFGVTAATGENAVARHYKRLIDLYFEKKISVKIKIEETELFGKDKRYLLMADHENAGEEILRETGILMVKKGQNYLTDGIYEELIKSKCCKKSYLKGMFLGTGTISDPKKSYHLEIVCATEKLAKDLQKMINSFYDLSCGVFPRRGKYVVYMKNSAYIMDTLTIMGAYNAVLKFEDVMLNKLVKGKTIRSLNCDHANMERAMDAAQEQIRVINLLKKNGEFDRMSNKLKEIANLRLKYPEASLTELGEYLDPPLKKSGVNNRIKRILELARN